ncbi:MAG: hypothetical protein ABIO86_12480 [Sphingomonas sp.]
MTTFSDKARLLLESGLFDEHWYVERYPDVLRAGMSPAEHFVRIGQHLGRTPRKGGNVVAASTFLTASRARTAADAISDDLRKKASTFHLFDAAWYRAHHAHDAGDDADLLIDYLKRSATDPRIDPGPLFSTSYYAAKHGDSVSMAPLIHACQYGFAEGRPVFAPQKVDTYLTENRDVQGCEIAQLIDRSKPVHIVYWSEGNFFFTEMAHYLRTVLSDAGYDVTCEPDLSDARADNIVVVAPHEFCIHGPGKRWKQQWLSQAVYLNTEQWHTQWFSLAFRYLTLSNKAIDMNPASAAGLQRLGVRTVFLPILPTVGSPFDTGRVAISDEFSNSRYILDLCYPDEFSARPYDVLFVGAANSRREAALALLAPVLADHDSFLHCPRFSGPVRQGDPDMMPTSDFVQIARNSKILLNIHQGESRYFEWHRLFLFGIMEGCVVLTEPCIPNRFVEAGRDYLECDLDAMPERLHWLLEDPDGQAEMRRVRANCGQLRQRMWGWSGLRA